MKPIELTSTRYTENDAMEIIEKTVDSHKLICNNIGIFSKYEEAINSGRNIGGINQNQCQIHLLGRFLNSAARIQLATLHPDDELAPINEQLLAQLYAGTLNIIDIAAGSGAGVISMINSVWYLRAISKELPTDKLDIYIHALDYAPDSLSYYQQQLASLKIDYSAAGIKVHFTSYCIDITNKELIESKVLEIKSTIGQDPRFLLVCSAISGSGKHIFERRFRASYELITQEFKQKNSIFFWVEPFTKKHWIKDILHRIIDTIFPSKPPLLHDIIIRFHWKDPHLENTITTGAEFYLIELAA